MLNAKTRVAAICVSPITIALNDRPLVPIGFIIAVAVVLSSAVSFTFLGRIRDEHRTLLLCAGAMLVGMLLFRMGCNISPRGGSGFSCNCTVNGERQTFALSGAPLPIRAWLAPDPAEQQAYVALYNEGVKLSSAGRYADALELTRRAAKINPDDPDLQLRFCLLYQALRKPELAKEPCAAVERAAPKKMAVVLTGVAVARMRQDAAKDAVVLARRAVKIDGQLARSHNILGAALLSGHEPGAAGAREAAKEAVGAFRRAAALQPNNGMFVRNLARALAVAGSCEDAERLQRKAEAMTGNKSKQLDQLLGKLCGATPAASGKPATP